MSDSEKINALDLVISVLKDHEKTLDSLIEKFENTLKDFSVGGKAKTVTSTKYNVAIQCEKWSEFRDACRDADAVSFKLDEELEIKAIQGDILYEYVEPVHRRMEIMECGIPAKLQTQLDPSELKRLLSKELNVPENRVIQGKIHFTTE